MHFHHYICTYNPPPKHTPLALPLPSQNHNQIRSILPSMDSSSSASTIPIAAIRSYHSRERQLYARMVLNLGLDSKRSMEVIAFWLWLEETGHMDVIHHVSCLDDYILQAIATLGQTFVEALRLDLPPDHPSHPFRREAIQGIIYYLNHVCFKVLEDIRRKAEEDANLRAQMEMLVHKMSQTSLDNGMNTRTPLVQPYVPYGEGTSIGVGERRVSGIPGIMEVERQIVSGYPFNLPMIGGVYPDSIMAFGNHQQQHHLVPYVRENIPREERTLFVTFSNGYPLTEDELHSFFTRNYGDVEAVTIQKPKGNRPPLFAHVSFYSLATVHRVLNGSPKVKFMTRGKHLWARRFYPKRNEVPKDE